MKTGRPAFGIVPLMQLDIDGMGKNLPLLHDLTCDELDAHALLAFLEGKAKLLGYSRDQWFSYLLHLSQSTPRNGFTILVEKVREQRNIQGQDGNWNYNEYMRGMYNGLETALATMQGREANFKGSNYQPIEKRTETHSVGDVSHTVTVEPVQPKDGYAKLLEMHLEKGVGPYAAPAQTVVNKRKHSHYYKDVSKFSSIDVYRVLHLFSVVDPCLQHAIKKLLVAGGRGAGKDITQDVKEAVDSLVRWQEMRTEEADSPL